MKKLAGWLCAALIIISLAGCNREEIPETQPPTPPPTEAVQRVELELPEDGRPYVGTELVFASHLGESDPRADVLRQAAEVFHTRTGAAVTFRWLDWEDAAMAAEVAEKGDVDIFSVTVDDLQKNYRYGTLDLTAMAETCGYAEHSYAALRDQVIERLGFLGAIPQEPVLYGMYYNADTLDKLSVTEYPDTWEDFLTFSDFLTVRGCKPLTIDYENANVILELFLERHYGRTRFAEMMAGALWTRDMAYINLFGLPIDYAAAGYLAKGDPTSFPGGQDKLALSNVVMTAGSNLLCPQVEESTGMDLNWGVFPFPGEGEGKGFAAESRVLAIRRESSNAQAAFDFIMLLTTGSFDQLYADVSLGIPADPANESAIRGAAQLLQQADSQGFGLLKADHNELFARLWSGYYKTPNYFASAMNSRASAYKIEPEESVG